VATAAALILHPLLYKIGHPHTQKLLIPHSPLLLHNNPFTHQNPKLLFPFFHPCVQ